MHLDYFETMVKDYVELRCREHLKLQAKLLGRPVTFDYRYEHTRTTAAIAEKLAVEQGIDPVLARIAAWLHDIAKCWDPGLDEAANRKREEDHGPIGGEEGADYLNSIGFPPDLTELVRRAIANHVGFIKDYILDEPLDALLWDADKLSKISGAGVLHYLSAHLTTGDELIDLQSFFARLDNDLHRGIRDSLNTEAARRWADKELAASIRLQRQVLAAMEGSMSGL